MTDTPTTRLKLSALLVAALVVLGMGTAAVVASQHQTPGDDAAGNHATTVTAENVEIERVTMENVSVSNLTVDLEELDDTDQLWQDVLAPGAGDSVEGFEVESVDVSNVEQADIDVENNTATVSAEIESITMEGVQADRVTTSVSATDGIAESMLSGAEVSFDSLTVEGLSVDHISTSDAVDEEPEAPDDADDEEMDDDEMDDDEMDDDEMDDEKKDDAMDDEDNVTDGDDNVTDGEADDGDQTAAVSFEDQRGDGTEVTVDSVTVPEGGYVAIHDDSLLDGEVVGSVIGVSEYLEPGTHENVTVTLYEVPGADFNQSQLTEEQTLIAMPHEENTDDEEFDFVETGGEADGAYLDDGEPVTDNATVSLLQ